MGNSKEDQRAKREKHALRKQAKHDEHAGVEQPVDVGVDLAKQAEKTAHRVDLDKGGKGVDHVAIDVAKHAAKGAPHVDLGTAGKGVEHVAVDVAKHAAKGAPHVDLGTGGKGVEHVAVDLKGLAEKAVPRDERGVAGGGQRVVDPGVAIDISGVVDKIGGIGGFGPIHDPGPNVPFDLRLTPHLHVGRPAGAPTPMNLPPDMPVFLAGEAIEVRVEEGRWAAAPRLRLSPTGTVPAPRGDTTETVRFNAPAAVGTYTLLADLQTGAGAIVTTFPGAAAFQVVPPPPTTLAVVRGPVALTSGTGSDPVRLEVVLPLDGEIDPTSLAIEVGGVPMPMNYGIGTTGGRARVYDTTIRYVVPTTEPYPLVVTGRVTSPLLGDLEFRTPIVVLALPVGPLVAQVAQGVLADLQILLDAEPAGAAALRQYVPCLPALPMLARLDGTPVVSRDVTVAVPGLGGQSASVRLEVRWEVGSGDGVLSLLGSHPRVPTATGASPVSALGMSVTPLPSPASAFDPFGPTATAPPPALTIAADVSAEVTLNGMAVTQPPVTGRAGPFRLPSVSLAAGLPVPTVAALYRCPDMRADWGGITPSHGAGEGALYLLAPTLPANVQLPNHRILGSAAGAVDVAVTALGLGPLLPGVRVPAALAALGDLGQLLGLLNGPVNVTPQLRGGLAMLAGRAASATSPAVAARIDDLLALSDAVGLLSASVAALIARGAGFNDPTSLFRTEFGRPVVNSLNVRFIDHGWPAVCDVQDETESALVIGRVGTTLRLFGAPDRSTDHGQANLAVDTSLTCLVPRFVDIGRDHMGSGGYPPSPPNGVRPLARPGRGYGSVTADANLRGRGVARLGGPGETRDETLARCVSSLDVVLPA